MYKFVLPFILILAFTSFGQYSKKKQAKLDSLNQLIASEAHDTIRAFAYLDLADLLYGKNLDTIVTFSLEAKRISEENLKKNDLNEAEVFKFNSILADATSNLGYVRINTGDYARGLELYLVALSIRERINDETGLANSYNNIASVHTSMDDNQKALDYYRLSLQIRIKNADVEGEALTYNNLGYTHQHMGQYDSALYYYNKAHDKYVEVDKKLRQAMTITNIGTVYRAQGDFDNALEYFLKGLEERRRLGSVSGLVFSLQNISNLYIEMGDYKKARPYAFEGYEIALTTANPKHLMRSANTVYRIFKKEGNYKASLENYELYISLKDSMQNQDLQKELVRQGYAYTYDKKAAADSVKNAEAQKVTAALLDKERAENEKKEQQSYFLYGGIGLSLIFGFFVFNRFLKTRKQKGQIEDQKMVVEEKNKEILDSITYAKGIQEAILPTKGLMQQLLPDNFVLYKPKDIVAGDFYWVDEIDNKVVFAVADCTGHGVPGAMVSVVCHNALHRSIHEFQLTKPNEILDKTRELVIETFESQDREVKDGMDIALCVLDKTKMKLEYAGANNSLYLVRNTELVEYKADKQPIGKYAANKPFSVTSIDLATNDLIYIFTDGYPDQFGGEKGKKFKYKNLKELLVQGHTASLSEQKALLDDVFEKWKGAIEQVDDVCIIGLRI